MIRPGTRWGPYEINGTLGSGGMGDVYRACDTRLGRDVAIKVLNPEGADDVSAQARFEREVRAIAALNHPNICAVYDVGIPHDGIPAYLVMELLEGETLQRRLARGVLDTPQVIEIGIALADALAAAHARGLIHRDLKPGNIFLTTRGIPKILDFGLAKTLDAAEAETRISAERLTERGVTVGTVGYMSPEQLRGEEVDARSDLFSLGVVLYEMATGRRAFDGTTSAMITAAILNGEPEAARRIRPELPARLEETISKLLEKDRAVRYQSAADLRAELIRIQRQIPSASTRQPPSSSDRAPRSGLLGRHPVAAIAISAILAAAGLFAFSVLRRNRTSGAGFDPSAIEIQPLTTSGDTFQGVISPDGKFIAYLRTEGSTESLWVSQIGTSAPLKLVTIEAPHMIYGLTVTPDSQQIDYVLYDDVAKGGDLMRVPELGGDPRKIAANVWSAVGWSGDGKTMAFVREYPKEKKSEIVLAHADGTNERVLATRRDPLIFMSNIFIGRPTARPAWSPDGSSLMVVGAKHVRYQSEIVVLDSSTGTERATRPSTCGQDLEAAWLSGSQWIASGDSANTGYQIVVGSLSGAASPVALTRDLANYRGISLTSDRRTAVSWRQEIRSGIWLGDGQGESWNVVVPESAAAPDAFSLNSSGDLLYTSRRGTGRAIWRLRRGAAEPQRVIERGDRPSSNADGSLIVYEDECDQRGLYRVEADGSGLQQIISAFAVWPVLTRDGTTTYFLEGPSQALWSIPMSGGQSHEISSLRVGTQPQVSPDGRRLIMDVTNDNTGAVEYFVCDLPKCTSPKPMGESNEEYTLKWTPNGNSLAFVKSSDPANLWIRPVAGGPAHQLTHFTDRKIDDFVWSPDGKHLAVTRSVEQSDIVRIRGFQP